MSDDIQPVGRAEFERLDRIATLLTERQRDATQAIRTLFSLTGFRADLVELARERDDVLLVDLPTLTQDSPPRVVPSTRWLSRAHTDAERLADEDLSDEQDAW